MNNSTEQSVIDQANKQIDIIFATNMGRPDRECSLSRVIGWVEGIFAAKDWSDDICGQFIDSVSERNK